MGLVLTMQLRPSLVSYGVQAELPVMVGIAIVREIGPVITALIFAGKIGSSIGAELGSMKVIGKNRNIFGSDFELKVRFSNLNGLMEGNNVLFSGIHAGTVKV